MIRQILDLARWAPSGDNSQPWRFEITGDYSARIHSFDLSKSRVYDYQGNYSQFSLGCLLETIQVVASKFSHPVKIEKSSTSTKGHLIYDVTVDTSLTIESDPLSNFIETRVTNRFPLSTKAISKDNKNQLQSVLPEGWNLSWLESTSDKVKIANLMYHFDILATPEVSGIIDWNQTFSKTHLPDESLGLDKLNLTIARWIFKSPTRSKWFIRFGGSYMSAFLGFFVPAFLCGAHFAITTPQPLSTLDDFVLSGRVFQRFWLMAANLGLYLQMESGPIIFSRYVRDHNPFTEDQSVWKKAIDLEKNFKVIFGEENAPKIFMLGRIGEGTPPKSRAIRLSLDELTYRPEDFGEFL